MHQAAGTHTAPNAGRLQAPAYATGRRRQSPNPYSSSALGKVCCPDANTIQDDQGCACFCESSYPSTEPRCCSCAVGNCCPVCGSGTTNILAGVGILVVDIREALTKLHSFCCKTSCLSVLYSRPLPLPPQTMHSKKNVLLILHFL